jgi:hypothetical protein
MPASELDGGLITRRVSEETQKRDAILAYASGYEGPLHARQPNMNRIASDAQPVAVKQRWCETAFFGEKRRETGKKFKFTAAVTV